MLTEKGMEDAIAKNPEKYIEKGLKLLSRQYRIGQYIFDLLFEDRHGSKLIVELQKGTLDRNHTYKIMDYYDEYKDKNPNEFVELMIIANKIPRERRNRLSSYGISFKEIPETEFPHSVVSEEKLTSNNKSLSSSFSHPTNISSSWDMQALNNVDNWLKGYLNRLPIGEHFEVGETAKSTRSIAEIKRRGNIDGVRYLLWKFHEGGHIDFPDNLHFRVRKRQKEECGTSINK